MKARRKGDTAPFEDVYKIVIGRGVNAQYIPINDVEFEQEQEPTSDHWQDVRERAAIAAMQGVISAPPIEGVNSVEEITDLAVRLADALIKKLKGE